MTDGNDLGGHVAGELSDGEILDIFVRRLALRALTAPETLHDDRTAQ